MIRVRLKFDSTPVSYAQKCWFAFDSEKCRVVKDVSYLISSHFGLKHRHGIQVGKERVCVHRDCFVVSFFFGGGGGGGGVTDSTWSHAWWSQPAPPGTGLGTLPCSPSSSGHFNSFSPPLVHA